MIGWLLCLWRCGLCCSFLRTRGSHKSLSLSLWIPKDMYAFNSSEINQNIQKIRSKQCPMSKIINLVPSQNWLKIFPFEWIKNYIQRRTLFSLQHFVHLHIHRLQVRAFPHLGSVPHRQPQVISSCRHPRGWNPPSCCTACAEPGTTWDLLPPLPAPCF